MSDLSKRLMMHCGNDSCEPCVKCAQIMQEAADELDRLLAIEREYNICRDRVAEIASRESEQHVEQRREIDRLQAIVDADARRLSWLSGCGGDDGPVIEGFAMLLDDFWSFLGDAIRERIGEENDSPDMEGTDEDKLAAFRAMIDEAMAAEKARHQC